MFPIFKLPFKYFSKISLEIFPLLFPHYLAETKLGVPLLTMIRFDPHLQDILELDFAKKGLNGKYFCFSNLGSFEDYDIEY